MKSLSFRFKHVFLICVSLFCILFLVQCKNDNAGSGRVIADSYEGYEKTSSGLFIKDIAQGQGMEVQEGDMIAITEELRYMDGSLIYHSDQSGGSVRFQVGGNQVISGIDEGVRGMKLGGQRSLIIPPALSKRSEYPDKIHPDSVLQSTIMVMMINRP